MVKIQGIQGSFQKHQRGERWYWYLHYYDSSDQKMKTKYYGPVGVRDPPRDPVQPVQEGVRAALTPAHETDYAVQEGIRDSRIAHERDHTVQAQTKADLVSKPEIVHEPPIHVQEVNQEAIEFTEKLIGQDRMQNIEVEVVNLPQQSKYRAGLTSIEEKYILKNVIPPCLFLFSGGSKIGEVRVDFNRKKSNATHIMDVWEFLDQNTQSFKTIILDPYYSKAEAMNGAKKNKHPTEGVYWYTNMYPPTFAPKTRALLDGVESLKPTVIIWKGWASAKFGRKGGDYKLTKMQIGFSGAARRLTHILVFQRRDHVQQSGYLDRYLPNNPDDEQVIEDLLAQDQAKVLPIKRGEFSEV